MACFTVYHGNNEATMFNAECTTGALVSHMIDKLLPQSSIYTRLELVPLAFVLDHFKPPHGANPTNATPRGGQQQQEAQAETNTTSKSPQFTGAIPFVGLSTRPVESYADAVLGGAASATSGPSPAAAVTGASASTSASGGSALALGAAGSGGVGPTTSLMSLQGCYVLLGCRHQHQQCKDRPCSPSANAAAIGLNSGKRLSTETFRRFCSPDVALDKARAASARRAHLIATVPIVPNNNKCNNSSANNAKQTPQQTNAAATDAALLLAYVSGLSLTADTSAPWRKMFCQYMTTLILPPPAEDCNETAVPNSGTNDITETQQEDAITTTTLLPPVATGLFLPPTPPITGYDVLWHGTRGEHHRLQKALDERFTITNEKQKKRPKRA